MSALDDLLAMTDPDGPLDWAQWRSQIQGPLADCLDRAGSALAHDVRRLDVRSRACLIRPVAREGRNVWHRHDRVRLEGFSSLEWLSIRSEETPTGAGTGAGTGADAEVLVWRGGVLAGRVRVERGGSHWWTADVSQVTTMLSPATGPWVLATTRNGPEVGFVANGFLSDGLEVMASGTLSGIGRKERLSLRQKILRSFALSR